MLQKAIQQYYKFFDETIQSSTFIVLIISMVILFIGSVVPANAGWEYMKGSILEGSKINNQEMNLVIIDGIVYEVNFSRKEG